MRIVVTAGPTREALDPVRFLSNRSSGKMGFAIARQAQLRGLDVVLIAGPVALETPCGVARVDVVSAREMLAALKEVVEGAEALVMAAAVADWRPAEVSAVKLKKAGMSGTLELVRNPDLLCELKAGKGERIHVGFAAETHDLRSEALRKLESKGLDLIVANDVSQSDAGFGVDTNRVTLFERPGGVVELELMSKDAVAERIVDWVVAEVTTRRPRS